jgi:hypothetical protein
VRPVIEKLGGNMDEGQAAMKKAAAAGYKSPAKKAR